MRQTLLMVYKRLYDGDVKIITILLFVYHPIYGSHSEMTGPVKLLMLASVELK